MTLFAETNSQQNQMLDNSDPPLWVIVSDEDFNQKRVGLRPLNERVRLHMRTHQLTSSDKAR